MLFSLDCVSFPVELKTSPEALTISNETGSIEVRCEMSQYIEPDNNLQWFRNGLRITGDSDKYEIHFEEGNSLSVFNGVTIMSRVSVLVVLDFQQQNDTGCYYCETKTTQKAAFVSVSTTPGQCTDI